MADEASVDNNCCTGCKTVIGANFDGVTPCAACGLYMPEWPNNQAPCSLCGKPLHHTCAKRIRRPTGDMDELGFTAIPKTEIVMHVCPVCVESEKRKAKMRRWGAPTCTVRMFNLVSCPEGLVCGNPAVAGGPFGAWCEEHWRMRGPAKNRANPSETVYRAPDPVGTKSCAVCANACGGSTWWYYEGGPFCSEACKERYRARRDGKAKEEAIMAKPGVFKFGRNPLVPKDPAKPCGLMHGGVLYGAVELANAATCTSIVFRASSSEPCGAPAVLSNQTYAGLKDAEFAQWVARPAPLRDPDLAESIDRMCKDMERDIVEELARAATKDDDRKCANCATPIRGPCYVWNGVPSCFACHVRIEQADKVGMAPACESWSDHPTKPCGATPADVYATLGGATLCRKHAREALVRKLDDGATVKARWPWRAIAYAGAAVVTAATAAASAWWMGL